MESLLWNLMKDQTEISLQILLMKEFGDLVFGKKCLLSELMGLDAREDFLGLMHEEHTCRTLIKGDIAHLASLEEIFWRQKSWDLCEGG